MNKIKSFENRYNKLYKDIITYATKDVTIFCNKYNLFFLSGNGAYYIHYKDIDFASMTNQELKDSIELLKEDIKRFPEDTEFIIKASNTLQELKELVPIVKDWNKLLEKYEPIDDLINPHYGVLTEIGNINIHLKK